MPTEPDKGKRPRLPDEERLFNAPAADAIPDALPERDIIPCDPPAAPEDEVFIRPNPLPPAPATPRLLPDALDILSRPYSVACDEDQEALSGDSPVSVGVGYDSQLVFLDDVAAITQDELYRIAAKISDAQDLVESSFSSAFEEDDYSTFDADLSDVLLVTLPIATAIRSELVLAQDRADAVAASYGQSLLTCGWRNRQLWVVCSDADLGYSVSFTEVSSPPEFASISAGVFESRVSQSDADASAARQAALQLDCLIGNDAWTETCTDVSASYDVDVAWPDTEGDDDTWDTTSPTALSTFDGRQFNAEATLGAGAGRVLRYSVTIPAGDSRAAASTKSEANEIAQGLALSALDCFFPSRPRKISCVTPDLGSDSVIARKAARSYDDDAMFSELKGGSGDGGLPYARTNVGVSDPGTEDEQPDTTSAYEVVSPAGIMIADTEDAANQLAEIRAANYLLCSWTSPEHACTCVDTEASQTADATSKFTTEEVTAGGANFKAAESSPIPFGASAPVNTLPRGLLVSDVFPGGSIGDVVVWPTIPTVCAASLTCVFDACKIAYCTPKPDTRRWKVNGMINYASYGPDWNDGPSTESDQIAFLTEWKSRRNTAISETFGGADAPCAGYANADACNGAAEPGNNGAGEPGNITDIGPEDWGTPARFKYGGVLRIGRSWGAPVTDDPGDGGPLVLASGRIKECSIVVTATGEGETPVWQEPEVWGFFSGAEGYARSLTPTHLGEQAAADAAGRLDCTHVNWPRNLANCPQSDQRGFGPVGFVLDEVVEGDSNTEVNEQAENLVLAVMECRDAHNFALAVEGSEIHMLAPVVAKVGEDNCMERGLHPATLLDSSCEPIEGNGSGMPATSSTHYYIEVACCDSEDTSKSLILHRQPANLTYDEAIAARQKGSVGTEDGQIVLESLKASSEEGEFWYIGTLYVGPATSLGTDDANRVTIQAYSGPIIIGQSCCGSSSDSSSSSSPSSSAPSSSAGSGSPAGSSAGSDDGSTGSSKSTAILQDPFGRPGEDFMTIWTVEAKDVRIEDTYDYLIDAPDWGGEVAFEINPRYVLSNEIDSVRLCSAVDQHGRTVRAKLTENNHVLRLFPSWRQRFFSRLKSERVTVRLSAIRKGFLGKQHAYRNAEQRNACEATLNSAYPGYSDD